MSELSVLTLEQVCDRLITPVNTLIIFHDRPDGDATGSAFGLALLLESMGSAVRCVCSSEVNRRYRFAVEGLQDSVLPCSVPDGFDAQRVITVDTAAPEQIRELRQQYSIDFMIDHHARGTPYADYLVRPDAAACGEIIYDIAAALMARGAIKALPPRFAGLIYMAIATDTGCFKYSNTTPGTHRRVAELMDGSFDYAYWNFRLFDAKTPEALTLTHAAIENIHYFYDRRLAVVAMDHAALSAIGISSDYYDGLIDVARSIDGVEVAVSLRQPDDLPVFRVSTRSNGNADVSAVCARFGGGGHAKAAGCSISAPDITVALDIIVSAVGEILK
ncbi:MAG: DHH family phosphoesterase [Eubacteriales bacterium]|nr:DHH family phosphoesterase [Eubacteriales bacterium]